MNELQFPPSFKFGVADADLQVIGEENTLKYENSQKTMWTQFAENGKTFQNQSPLPGIDRYHRWKDDIALIAGLGTKHYRTSISMARTMTPDKKVNTKAIKWYKAYFKELKKQGISIYATLYHWELPEYLSKKGGWKNRETIDYLVRHAEIVHEHLGEYIDEYFILNEPWCSTFFSYHTGDHAPGEKNLKGALASVHNILIAQGVVYRTLRSRNKNIRISTVYNPVSAYALTPTKQNLKAQKYSLGYYTTWFTDPLYKGSYPSYMMELFEPHLPKIEKDDMETMHIGDKLYSFGVNYYYSSLVAYDATKDIKFKEVVKENSILNGLNWPTFIPPNYSYGFYDLFTMLYQMYEPHGMKRIYVTENGTAWNSHPHSSGEIRDDFRIFYVSKHLEQVHAAICAGVPIQAYFLWTLMDNYEWQFGYIPESCFGIVHVDRNTYKRTPKKSYFWYKSIIEHLNLLPVNSVYG